MAEKSEEDAETEAGGEGEREWQPRPLGGIQAGMPWPQRHVATALTWVVPAAPCSGASPPVPIHLGEFPLLVGVTGEGIRGQVADLQARIVPQEVTEGHPGKAETGCPEL